MTNSTQYFLGTSRLGFRRWREADVDIALGLWGDPNVTRRFDARGKLSKDQIRQRLAQEISCQREHGIQYWPIFNLKTREHVGCCGLRPYDLSREIYEIGFHIRSDRWRQGYASEAAAAVIDYAFDTLKAKALFAGHHPQNDASRHLLAKLGFRYTHDEYYPPTGLYHPSYLLNADKWQSAGSTMKKHSERKIDMTRRLISSGSTFEKEIGYSRAVVDGNWIFVSGTTGFDYQTMTISDNLEEQTEQCLRNIQAALTQAGADLQDVVRVTYILPQAEDFKHCWPTLRNCFGEIRPAATMISAGLADPRAKIEIEVTARRRTTD